MIIRLKVLLVDDRTLFREGLQGFLQANGIEVAGTARDGTEALEQAGLLKPEVILINITRSGQIGLETIRRVKAENPAVKIVVLAESDEELIEAVRSGACGYLLTSIKGEELLQKLLALERGEVPFSPGLTARVLEKFARRAVEAAEKERGLPVAEAKKKEQAVDATAKEQRTPGAGQGQVPPVAESGRAGPAAGEGEALPLTARQKEILDLVGRGLTYREAGEALGLKERTVKYHMEQIKKSLQLKKREQVIAYALRGGCEPESG